MPSIKDKLAAEQQVEQNVRLWPEGTFYKAYERSAYLFVTQVRPYEVRRRHVQVAGTDVVSLGFPQTVVDALACPHERQADGTVLLRLDAPLDEQAFRQWRDALPMDTPRPKASAPEQAVTPKPAPVHEGAEHTVATRLRAFNLADATPMQCMMLVVELQRILKEVQP